MRHKNFICNVALGQILSYRLLNSHGFTVRLKVLFLKDDSLSVTNFSRSYSGSLGFSRISAENKL